MLHNLSTTLKAILDDTEIPDLVRNADVAFERPVDSYNPATPTINLFLYDVRENTELRSNEPVIERQNGIATIRKPPLRVASSYQVTAWSGPGTAGEAAILDQHQLLGAVLKVFSGISTIPEKYLQGNLKTTLYPVSLVTAQADLMRNPAEFWTAMGGKIRPSFTVTATIAMDQDVDVVTAPEVSSKVISLQQIGSDVANMSIAIGGTVRDAATHATLTSVELTLVELGIQATSDSDGRFQCAAVGAGQYVLRAVKQGYQTKTKAIRVPGTSPTSFDIDLSST
ncbi:MAG: DUF4255 domain-containing protein [Nitrospira sp.]|nr:MAG: DUF4255 domain-containing protein [Nitrospira sp.]